MGIDYLTHIETNVSKAFLYSYKHQNGSSSELKVGKIIGDISSGNLYLEMRPYSAPNFEDEFKVKVTILMLGLIVLTSDDEDYPISITLVDDD